MIKKALIPALALAAAATVAVPGMASAAAPQPPAAHAAGPAWQPIAQRKHSLDRRIEVGIRSGQLSRREAVRLQNELNQLVRLENSYRRGGLSLRERRDLDRRYDRLAAQIRYERRDRDGRRW